MKTILILISAVLIITSYSSAQSIYDIADGTETEIGTGAEICADQQTGNGILSGLGTFCGGTLPVELSSFIYALSERNVTLSWTTANETNNKNFGIQRKDAGSDIWKQIASVDGAGNSEITVNYNYTDRSLLSGKYRYRLKQTDFNGNFEYYELDGEVSIGIPDKFNLSQNYPNPFNPSTTIAYDIPADGKVNLTVYDITGKIISALIDQTQPAGYYSVSFNASSLTTGTYFYKLTFEGVSNNFTAVKKMIVVK